MKPQSGFLSQMYYFKRTSDLIGLEPYSKCIGLEPYSKYIEENYFSYFLSMQETSRYLLKIVALYAWYEAMIVGR